MKIAPDPLLIDKARSGDIRALEALMRQVQQPVFNLAIRMIGRREDAQDATQEIMLKVVTHLGSWRNESAFGTWVFGIARNHLLNARQRRPDRRELSFDTLGDALEAGEAYARSHGLNDQALTPEDKLAARETAISCTQAMLMCLDQPGRLAYVLDVVFGLSSPEAAEVQGITAAAHRQRLARAREAVQKFMERRCGLASETATCHCSLQVPAKRAVAKMVGALEGPKPTLSELDTVAAELQNLMRLSDAAAVMRGSPQYQASDALVDGIRDLIQRAPVLRQ